jgi:hypothetical protein
MAPNDTGKSHPSGSSDAAPAGESPDSSPDPVAPRPLTIDDVPRLGSGAGIAVGCTVFVVGAIALFWLVRGWFLHAP